MPIRGGLGRIRLAVPVAVGFDVITLGRREEDYPTLLDLPAPRLWTYPRETMIAEKSHAMASLGERISRVRDVWEVAYIARRSVFGGDTPRNRTAEDLRCRRHFIGRERPARLPAYYDNVAPPRYC